MQLDLNDVSRGRESTFPSLPLGVSTEQTSNINVGRGQGHWREHIPPGTAAARPQESGIGQEGGPITADLLLFQENTEVLNLK